MWLGAATSPRLANRVVYFGSLGGRLCAPYAKASELLCMDRAGSSLSSAPKVADGMVHVTL